MNFAANLALTGVSRSSIVKKELAHASSLEFSMFTRFLFAAASLLIAAAVVAQTAGPVPKRAVLGKATDVRGLVTVSDANGVGRVVANNDVIDRNRYVTSSTGHVTLKMDKGCDIELNPNQALTVEDERSCEALWASIESMDSPAGALLAGGGAAAGAGAAAFLVGGSAVLILGGGSGGGASASGGGGGGVPGGGGGGDGGNGGQIPTPPPIISPQ
jgi:hypothetical protein